jgi:hypothetical protein
VLSASLSKEGRLTHGGPVAPQTSPNVNLKFGNGSISQTGPQSSCPFLIRQVSKTGR